MELSGRLDEVASGGQGSESVTQDGLADPHQRESNNSITDIIRIKKQMSNQAFEMSVRLQAGKCKKTSEDERDLPDYVNELEEEKTNHFNKTLALHRMQLWHAISEKLQQNDPEAEAMRELSSRTMELCFNITELQRESCQLQDQITDLQKQRLELKRLTHEQMKEMDELKRKKEHPEMEKYRNIIEKGQSNLVKYHKMATITQNVLRGVILASKVNWRDDPKLRAIAMTLEDVLLSED